VPKLGPVHDLTEREVYLFDVQGWLVIPGIIESSLLKAINDALDANQDRCGEESEDLVEGSKALAGEHRRRNCWGMLQWPHPHCEPFRELIAYQPLIRYLDGVLGRGWHLDHDPEVFDYPPGTEGHALHFGQPFPQDGVWYQARGGTLRSGLLAVEFLLTDQPAGRGGFCAIAGSHKANFPRPEGISLWEQDQSVVSNPGARAGDVIMFTEAVAHGTLPWRNEFDRRVAVYRYAPKTVQYASSFHKVVMPNWADELTAAQRAALEPAHFYDKAIIEPDGSVSRPWEEYDEPAR
jgi:ectoine hydroxylase-related dioxygenase (phytanoyl-CoA dioxygenase family)